MTDSKITQLIDKIIDKETIRYGFAYLAGLLQEKYSKFHYGISILRKLDDAIIDSIKSGPTKEYFEHYKSVNLELTDIVRKIEYELKQIGIDCIGIKPTYHDSELDAEYEKTLRTEISQKMIATRAGLGWIGKTDLLVTYKFGPRVRLASVLIDYPFKSTGTPVENSECGKCNACVIKCPGDTSTSTEWNINIDRNEFFDPFKCRNTCKKLSKERINEDISICGICISVCPVGKGTKNGIELINQNQ